jgi:hypothetical protein
LTLLNFCLGKLNTKITVFFKTNVNGSIGVQPSMKIIQPFKMCCQALGLVSEVRNIGPLPASFQSSE